MRTQTLKGMLIAMTVSALAVNSFGGAIIKADNADALNLASSWVGGVVPGTNDVATWNAALTAGRTYALGADLSWLGLAFTADPGGNVTFSSGATLTIGAEGIYSVPNRTMTFNNAFTLDTDQTWHAASGTFIPAAAVTMNDHTLTLTGAATKQFKGAISGNGTIINNGGQIKFTNTGTAAPTTDIILNNANLQFETATGLASGPRTKSLTMNGGILAIGGRSNADTIETNANALTIGPGYAYVGITPDAAKNAQFYSGSFELGTNGGVAVFRGPALGLNALSSPQPNTVNIAFGTPPTLSGANGEPGSTTNSILIGAIGDYAATVGVGTGLVTYASSYGIRLLDFASEYKPSLTDGQTQLDNVRLANTSGSGILTATLTQPITTVNAFVIDVTGAGGNGGVTVEGEADTTLRVASGMVLVNQAATTPATTDIQLMSVPNLDFNGNQGIIVRHTRGVSNGQASAPLSLRSAITNDGGHGVVFAGTGITYLDGSAPSTYTGPTVNHSGFLRITKTVSNIGIPGDLVVYGGTVQSTGNQIPDTSDIYVHGGSWLMKAGASNSGSGTSDTYRDLIVTGGTAESGASGTSSGATVMRNATLSGGQWNGTKGHSITMSGDLTLNGGLANMVGSTDGVRGAIIDVAGNVLIQNPLRNAYTPLSLGSATGAGAPAKLILRGSLTYTGHLDNPSMTTIATGASGAPGQILLNGTRTFDIGNGLAETDLAVSAILTNNGATVGGLVKTGAGTLALNGANTYTGGTSVNEGTLAGTGSLASDISVAAGAALAPGTAGTVGTFTVTGNVSFAAASVYRADIDGDTADLLAVSGEVSGGLVTVEVSAIPSDSVRLMTATEGITASFVSSQPDLALVKMANNTELWIRKSKGTVIRIF